MRYFKWVPFQLLLFIAWASFLLAGVHLSDTPRVSLPLVVAAVVVLSIEFFKSGDIGMISFQREALYALVGVACVSGLIVHALEHGLGLGLVDLLIACCIVVGAWISLVNSFRTALRNWSGAISNQPQGGQS